MLDREVTPKWRGRKIQDIARRDVVEVLDGLMDRGVGRMTNMVFSVLRKLFRWCVERDVIAVSPCTGMRPPCPEASRDRVLNDGELKRFWAATDALGYPFGPMFKLLLVTGQRLGEVAGIIWTEIHLDERIWSLPRQRAKNDRAHEVPLSDLAIEIVESLPKSDRETALVFTTTGKTPVSGFSRAKRHLDAAMRVQPDQQAIPPWTLHDLRRTVATGMQRLGITPQVTEAVLNHKSGTIRGVAAVYARHDYAQEKRDALDAWAQRLVSVAL